MSVTGQHASYIFSNGLLTDDKEDINAQRPIANEFEDRKLVDPEVRAQRIIAFRREAYEYCTCKVGQVVTVEDRNCSQPTQPVHPRR